MGQQAVARRHRRRRRWRHSSRRLGSRASFAVDTARSSDRLSSGARDGSRIRVRFSAFRSFRSCARRRDRAAARCARLFRNGARFRRDGAASFLCRRRGASAPSPCPCRSRRRYRGPRNHDRQADPDGFPAPPIAARGRSSAQCAFPETKFRPACAAEDRRASLAACSAPATPPLGTRPSFINRPLRKFAEAIV